MDSQLQNTKTVIAFALKRGHRIKRVSLPKRLVGKVDGKFRIYKLKRKQNVTIRIET